MRIRRPGWRFWVLAAALASTVVLREQIIDLFVPKDEILRTTAGPIDAIELRREGAQTGDAPLLRRADLAAGGYREVLVEGRRYRATDADGWFVVPAGAAPRWLVIEQRLAPTPAPDAWARRMRRFVRLRVVDRERGDVIIAQWPGPLPGRGTDAEQAVAFVKTVLPPRAQAAPPAAAQPRRSQARIEPAPAQAPVRPPTRVEGCPAGVAVSDASGRIDTAGGDEVVTAGWIYGVPRRVGSVRCDATSVYVEHAGDAQALHLDRLSFDGATLRSFLARGPDDADRPEGSAEARLVAVQASAEALSVVKRFYAEAPPHRALYDMAVDFTLVDRVAKPGTAPPKARRKRTSRPRA